MAAHIDKHELTEREEAKKILRDQIAIEGELIALYEKSVQEIPNVLIQQMLRTIRHDSQKHISMLSVLVDFLDGKEVYARALRLHIQIRLLFRP